MMKRALFLFLLLVMALPAYAQEKTGTLDQVTKSGTIRAAYLVYPPYFQKDTATGEMSGIFYDLMMAIGKISDTKIEWTEEVGYEQIFSGLDTNRYDVFAGGLWAGAKRSKAGYFSVPVYYDSILAWGRAGDTRFDKNLDAANNENISIAVVDGAMEDIIAQSSYPLAKRNSLPAMSPYKMNLINVMEKKADLTFAEPTVVHDFMKSNPGKLKELNGGKPVRIFGVSLVTKRGEDDFKHFIDAGIEELAYSGEIEKILNKYEPYPNAFRRVALPYR
jgi:ABC-type amino acid transport substrate-binding protein